MKESQGVARRRESEWKRGAESATGYPRSQQSARVKETETGEGESQSALQRMKCCKAKKAVGKEDGKGWSDCKQKMREKGVVGGKNERQVWGPIGQRGAIWPCR